MYPQKHRIVISYEVRSGGIRRIPDECESSAKPVLKSNACGCDPRVKLQHYLGGISRNAFGWPLGKPSGSGSGATRQNAAEDDTRIYSCDGRQSIHATNP